MFRLPVDINLVQDYTTIVKNPMDLSIIRKKIEKFEYKNCEDYKNDLELIYVNSKAYNGQSNLYLINILIINI